MSGSTVEQELALHYGRLPPAFLPIGAQRLITLQSLMLVGDERGILTLPSDFKLSKEEINLIDGAGFEVVATDPLLSVTEALMFVLKKIKVTEPIRLLFGDTLVKLEGVPDEKTDFVAVQSSGIDYPWTYGENCGNQTIFVEADQRQCENSKVVCGYFSFADVDLLRKGSELPTLHETLNFYSSRRQLELIEASSWHDFGHLALFYKSRRDLLVSRAFNSIDAHEFVLTKTSHETAKMHAEATWFESIPQNITLHTPRYIGRKNKNYQAGYQLEYLHLPTLSDMAVAGRVPDSSMGLILSRCIQLIQGFRDIRPPAESPEASPDYATYFYDEIIRRKTWSRLDMFVIEFGCNIDSEFTLNGVQLPPLKSIVSNLLERIPKSKPEDICFWHGDFFYGNLFFDFNTQRVMMIDPRGMLFDNVITQFGDYRYDIGKLAHSVLGGYDHIIANQFEIDRPTRLELNYHLSTNEGNQTTSIMRKFYELVKVQFGISEENLNALAAFMFFSMLPLHKDCPKRQAALLANGLNLAMKSGI